MRKSGNQGISLLKMYTFEGVSVREQLRMTSHYMQVVVSIETKESQNRLFCWHQWLLAIFRSVVEPLNGYLML
jgi:hypothetical protein